MGSIAKYRKKKAAILTATLMAAAYMPTAFAVPAEDALPEGGKFVSDVKGTISKEPDKAIKNVVLNGKKGIIEWDSFSVGSKAAVNFSSLQGKGWLALNKVVKANPSEIYGAINGQDGTVFLINPNGITFGETASVDVGSFVASTMGVTEKDNKFIFSKDSNSKAITINEGAKIAARDGYVAIFAPKIENYGTITARDVAMASGKQIEFSYDNKINLKINVSNNNKSAKIDTEKNCVLISAKDVDNFIADSIINNSGKIQVAKSITKDETTGELVLAGDGGNITMAAARVLVNGELNASGDKGGTITTSGYEVMQVNDGAKVQAASQNGEAGTWNVIGNNLSTF